MISNPWKVIQFNILLLQCTGPSCQSGSDLNQTVEITQSVAFIDVSKPAVGFQGEPPIFLAKVPYDFFYPFISGAVSSTMSITLLQLLLMVSLTFIAVWFLLWGFPDSFPFFEHLVQLLEIFVDFGTFEA